MKRSSEIYQIFALCLTLMTLAEESFAAPAHPEEPLGLAEREKRYAQLYWPLFARMRQQLQNIRFADSNKQRRESPYESPYSIPMKRNAEILQGMNDIAPILDRGK